VGEAGEEERLFVGDESCRRAVEVYAEEEAVREAAVLLWLANILCIFRYCGAADGEGWTDVSTSRSW